VVKSGTVGLGEVGHVKVRCGLNRYGVFKKSIFLENKIEAEEWMGTVWHAMV
jgi:hypothetical protein